MREPRHEMNSMALECRSAEFDQVRSLVGPVGAGAGRALVLLGEAGTGKSTILTALRAYADARDWRVLAATGGEGSCGLAFTGLRQLLRPVLSDVIGWPGERAEELRAAIGLGTPSASRPGSSLAGLALLELLTAHAGPSGGVLLVVDDVQLMDASSLEALACAACRLDAGPVAMIFAARGDRPPAELAGGIPQVWLGPLSATGASQLLDAQPHPPRGLVRAQVLAQAAGNPLALVELSRARRTTAGFPLPLTGRLDGMLATQLSGLPARTRHALLLIAAADGTDLDTMTRAARGPDAAVLAPAEENGLITVAADELRFRHPLARSAVYYAAAFATRAAAHHELAGILNDQADRRAWHLGAACRRPDENIASLLAVTAADAGRRTGAMAEALALHRAADLTPEPGTQAARLIATAEAAIRAGQAEWAQDLTERALALPGEASLRPRGRLVAGRALTWTGQPARAAAILLPLARQTAARDPAHAWLALAAAATAAYQAGRPEDGQRVAEVLAELPPPADEETRAARLWALAVSGQASTARRLLKPLARAAVRPDSLTHAGAAAWLLDQPADAIALLAAAHEARTEGGAQATTAGLRDPLGVLGWACFDAGRWDEALAYADRGAGPHPAGGTDSTQGLIAATVEAARGHSGRSRKLVAAALAAAADHSRLLVMRARHALGLAALADGDYEAAFDQLRSLFAENGMPYHYYAFHLAAGDLALAAARSGRRLEGRKLLKQIQVAHAGTGSQPSPRVRLLIERANGVLADPATPDAYRVEVLSEPPGDQWPFEQAKLRLEAGEWLRRQRRINEAKPVLNAALDIFRALRAEPWELRAETELRACGVVVPGTLADSARLRKLTPQQRRILGLAAQGLSNREIGQRLFLSPRTVASHLYRSFPLLGVAGRHQLQLIFPPS